MWGAMQSRFNVLVAIVLALVPVPALKLLDHFGRGCGDGLCGFLPGLMILGGFVGATLYFLFRSARRGEEPMALRLVPFLIWAATLAHLVF